MDWAQILVIILSIFLAVFLLLGIVLTILLIRLKQQIKSVTSSAQRTVGGIESFVSTVSKFGSPALVVKALAGRAKRLRKKKGEE